MKCKMCGNEIPAGSIFCNWCGERQIKQRKKKDEISVPKPRKLKSGTWFAQVTVDGVREPVSAPTEAEYYTKARAIKAGLIEQRKRKAGKTLSEAIDEYIESRRATVSPSTIQTYKKLKRLYFQQLMDTDILNVTLDALKAEVAQMITQPTANGNRLSAKTIKDSYSFIVSVLQYHKVQLDYKDVALPQIQDSPFAVLTKDEISTLIKALPESPCELHILLALWLGLRRSEIIALEKSDFDIQRKTVSINKAVVRDENGEYVSKGTKTAKSARVINCPDYIIDKVKELPEGPIYTHDVNYILKCLHKVCEDNNLPPVRLHDLRHINASVGLMLGIPDKYVMERNGWALKDTMVYRYEHTYSEEKEQADKTYNSFFEDRLKHQITNENANKI